MRTVRIVLASLLLVAGCSSAEAGDPVAQDPPPTSETETETESERESAAETTEETTSTAAPPVDRPKPIDLTTIDICQVLGALPLRSYKLDGDRPPLAGDSSLFPGSKDCFANGIDSNVSLLIIAVTSEGARSFVDTANVAARAEGTAAGYPLTVLTPQAPASCIGIVDVHDGQMLYVSYGLGSPTARPVTPQRELCRTVPKIATAAMRALG